MIPGLKSETWGSTCGGADATSSQKQTELRMSAFWRWRCCSLWSWCSCSLWCWCIFWRWCGLGCWCCSSLGRWGGVGGFAVEDALGAASAGAYDFAVAFFALVDDGQGGVC